MAESCSIALLRAAQAMLLRRSELNCPTCFRKNRRAETTGIGIDRNNVHSPPPVLQVAGQILILLTALGADIVIAHFDPKSTDPDNS